MHSFIHWVVLAQLVLDGPAAPTSISGKIFEGLLSPGGMGVVLTTVLSIVGGLLAHNAIWKRRIALAAYHCFHVVEDIAADDESQNGIDKAAEFLKQLDGYCAANGWRPLKPADKILAQYQAQSMSGQTVVATAQAVAAAAAAPPSVVQLGAKPPAIVPPPPAP